MDTKTLDFTPAEAVDAEDQLEDIKSLVIAKQKRIARLENLVSAAKSEGYAVRLKRRE